MASWLEGAWVCCMGPYVPVVECKVGGARGAEVLALASAGCLV